jgi:signal peptidase
MKTKSVKKFVGIAVAAFLVGVLVVLPVYAGTRTYPLAVVEGNSMYPNLQSGDLVIYKATDTMRIPNGTVIVFVQEQLGIPVLDSLTQPTIVHRVVGEVVQRDGVVYYLTRGDNNQFTDPALVRYDKVLGVEVQAIPKAGIPIQYLKSPQGLVATIALITLFYLGNYDAKMKEGKRKEEFLGALVQAVQNGEMSNDLFKKLEPLVKYSHGVRIEGLTDPASLALVDWLRKGGLEHKWKLNRTTCTECSRKAFSFESRKDLLFVVCPNCADPRRLGANGQVAVPTADAPPSLV